MTAPLTDYYVDPSIAANSGAGTIGDPYGDLQYALDTVTADTADGDRFNVKAGTSESLTAVLSFATYGAPSYLRPVEIRGYTSASSDGGQGSIDCNANQCINATAGVSFVDMEIFDGPSGDWMVELGLHGCIINCEVHTTSGDGVLVNSYGVAAGNNIYDVGDSTHDMLSVLSSATAMYNYLRNGLNEAQYAIDIATHACTIVGNIVSVDGATIGIRGGNVWACRVIGNTVFSISGTGVGIAMGAGNAVNLTGMALLNNYVEGFSGTGGKGIQTTRTSTGTGVYGKNAVYNNTTNYDWPNETVTDIGDNETLSASGIAKSGADTFANRFVYFAPADEGNMQTGGYPEA